MVRDQSRWWWLAPVSAAGFLVSGATYVVVTLGLTGPTEPQRTTDLDAYLVSYFSYRRDLLAVEQLEGWALWVAVLALGLLLLIGRLAGLFGDGLTPRVSGVLAFTGAVVFAMTQVAYLGALDSALHTSNFAEFDKRSLGTLTDFISNVDDYVENAGLLLMAAGVLGLSATAGSGRFVRWWRVLAPALACAAIVIVVTSFAELSLANDVALGVTALFIAPACAVALGSGLRRTHAPVSV